MDIVQKQLELLRELYQGCDTPSSLDPYGPLWREYDQLFTLIQHSE